jgi:hypothetical protein
LLSSKNEIGHVGRELANNAANAQLAQLLGCRPTWLNWIFLRIRQAKLLHSFPISGKAARRLWIRRQWLFGRIPCVMNLPYTHFAVGYGMWDSG